MTHTFHLFIGERRHVASGVLTQMVALPVSGLRVKRVAPLVTGAYHLFGEGDGQINFGTEPDCPCATHCS